jgi:hypothetical protein
MTHQNAGRHKVFLSYCHRDDQYYRNLFEKQFGHLFVDRFVEPGGIDTDISAEYINRLIEKGYITDNSVLVVLVGERTWGRRHIDWEISAGLDRRMVGHTAGLMGIRLPTQTDYDKSQHRMDTVPPRLRDNLKTGYAKFCDWTESESILEGWIEDAFQARIARADKVDNSRRLFVKDRS